MKSLIFVVILSCFAFGNDENRGYMVAASTENLSHRGGMINTIWQIKPNGEEHIWNDDVSSYSYRVMIDPDPDCYLAFNISPEIGSNNVAMIDSIDGECVIDICSVGFTNFAAPIDIDRIGRWSFGASYGGVTIYGDNTRQRFYQFAAFKNKNFNELDKMWLIPEDFTLGDPRVTADFNTKYLYVVNGYNYPGSQVFVINAKNDSIRRFNFPNIPTNKWYLRKMILHNGFAYVPTWGMHTSGDGIYIYDTHGDPLPSNWTFLQKFNHIDGGDGYSSLYMNNGRIYYISDNFVRWGVWECWVGYFEVDAVTGLPTNVKTIKIQDNVHTASRSGKICAINGDCYFTLTSSLVFVYSNYVYNWNTETDEITRRFDVSEEITGEIIDIVDLKIFEVETKHNE